MRVAQPSGTRGSLRWIQFAVNKAPDLLKTPELPEVKWVSPLTDDEFAEYRDSSFLRVIGQADLRDALSDFWPARGPQWDALGVAGDAVVLVEAKAHLDELFSSCAAGEKSRARIRDRFQRVRQALKAQGGVDWTERFYQYANRLAHLWFLRANGVQAYLLLVGFVNDTDVCGPKSEEEWRAAFRMADYALGLPKKHMLSSSVIHVFPDVSKQ